MRLIAVSDVNINNPLSLKMKEKKAPGTAPCENSHPTSPSMTSTQWMTCGDQILRNPAKSMASMSTKELAFSATNEKHELEMCLPTTTLLYVATMELGRRHS